MFSTQYKIINSWQEVTPVLPLFTIIDYRSLHIPNYIPLHCDTSKWKFWIVFTSIKWEVIHCVGFITIFGYIYYVCNYYVFYNNYIYPRVCNLTVLTIIIAINALLSLQSFFRDNGRMWFFWFFFIFYLLFCFWYDLF